MGGRVCYGLWMCLIYATCPGIYVIIAAEVIQAFGPLHYQANFGLLFTQNVAYCVVIIVITKVGTKVIESLVTNYFLIIFRAFSLSLDTQACSS